MFLRTECHWILGGFEDYNPRTWMSYCPHTVNVVSVKNVLYIHELLRTYIDFLVCCAIWYILWILFLHMIQYVSILIIYKIPLLQHFSTLKLVSNHRVTTALTTASLQLVSQKITAFLKRLWSEAAVTSGCFGGRHNGSLAEMQASCKWVEMLSQDQYFF